MSDTDRQLGYTEERLRQALEALRECRDALSGAATVMRMQQRIEEDRKQRGSSAWTPVIDYVESAKIAADFILALHAKRRIGTECAAVAKDVLLAGVGCRHEQA